MKTILFDVDGVLADFVYGFTGIGARLFGIEQIHTDKQPSWDDLGLDKQQYDRVWEEINKSMNFWYKLLPLVPDWVFSEINGLCQDNHVVFCTNRNGGNPNPQYQTAWWLKSHGILRPNVILSKRKGEIARAIDADFAIDDKAENVICIHWIADVKPCRSFLLDQIYNREAKLPEKVVRVFSVEDFLEEVNR